MTLNDKVTSLYKRGAGSPKAIAKICGVSEKTVRRILITAGLWTSIKTDMINGLYEDGYSLDEIASVTGMQAKNILNYLPYPNGPRADWPDNERAKRLREYRRRKKWGAGMKS